jgi:hypothetical protein
LRGRSAAAAALSMAKDAAVASTIFIMTIPLCLDSVGFEKPRIGATEEGRPPLPITT